MELNNTSKYAIRILSYIANNSDGKLLSARELSETLDIPYRFLTKIMTDLVKENYLISIKGREGGNKLSRDASEITLMEILNTFNEFNNQTECLLGIGDCDHIKKCALHDQWIEPKTMIHSMFENTTLKDLDGENFKITVC